MNIGILLKDWRYAEKLGVREAAKIMGLSVATFNRVERGELMDGATLATILEWAFRPQTSPHL
jgi:transcriptional regulator with XRE-family HTH domain